MNWRDAIRLNDEAFRGFNTYLDTLKVQAQREQDDAATWDAAKEAIGKKKMLDVIRAAVTMNQREETAYARAYGRSETDGRPGA